MVELIIDSIRVGLRHYRRVVVLREKDSDRYLTIWIGPDVAEAIALRLQDVAVPRPQTHDLLFNMISELGGVVTSITVNDLKDDTFFAKIQVRQGDTTLEIDSRPSDAIALAVRAKVPIYAADDVLERAGIVLDEEGEPVEANHERATPPTEEELKKLAAFKDFVEELDLSDFGESESS